MLFDSSSAEVSREGSEHTELDSECESIEEEEEDDDKSPSSNINNDDKSSVETTTLPRSAVIRNKYPSLSLISIPHTATANAPVAAAITVPPIENNSDDSLNTPRWEADVVVPAVKREIIINTPL